MLYKIIGDSCMDLTEELKLDPHFQMIPLTLQIGDYKVNPNSILDDNIKLVAYDDPIYEADSFVETELCRKGAKTRAAGWCNGDKDTIIIRFTTNERMPNGKEESFPVNVKVNWNSLPKFVKEVAKFCW